MSLSEHDINCPYCGELMTILLNPASGESDYVEDCQVCCRPIEISLAQEFDGSFQVLVRTDSE